MNPFITWTSSLGDEIIELLDDSDVLAVQKQFIEKGYTIISMSTVESYGISSTNYSTTLFMRVAKKDNKLK